MMAKENVSPTDGHSPEYAEDVPEQVWQHAPAGLFYAGMDAHIVKTNRAFAGLLGYPFGELDGRREAELTHPDDVLRSAELFREVGRDSAGPRSMRKRYRSRDGRTVWARLTVAAVPGPDGAPWLIAAHVSEIEVELEAERRVADAKSLIGAILDASPVGIVVVDLPVGRIRLWNDVARALLEEDGERAFDLPSLMQSGRWPWLRPDGTPCPVGELPLSRALAGEIVRGQRVSFRPHEGRARALAVNAVRLADAGSVVLTLRATQSGAVTSVASERRDLVALLGSVSSGLLRAGGTDFGVRIRESLATVARAVGATQAGVVLFSDDLSEGHVPHSWTEPGVAGSVSEPSGPFRLAAFERTLVTLGAGRPLVSRQADDLPAALRAGIPVRTGQIPSFACFPLRAEENLVGCVCFLAHPVATQPWPRFSEDLGLFADFLTVALLWQHVSDELTRQRDGLRELGQRLRHAREDERATLSRRVHDDLGQMLAALQMSLWALERSLQEEDATAVGGRIQEMKRTLKRLLERVRRIADAVRPPDLGDLRTAMERVAGDFQRVSGVECRVEVIGSIEGVSPAHAEAALGIAQEALTNVMRHARDSSLVRVTLAAQEGGLDLTVRDDGAGIAEESLVSPRSLGIVGMRERAAAVGGTLSVGRHEEGGTLVRASLP